MPATRSFGTDQEFYPWSPIVTRPPLRWPGNARVALAVIVPAGAAIVCEGSNGGTGKEIGACGWAALQVLAASGAL